MVNKKGGEGVPWWTVLMIIAVVVGAIMIVIFGRGASNLSKEVIAKQIEQKLSACKSKGERGQLDGTSWPDKDKDGLPDHCDNCPDLNNFDPDIAKDEDGDFFPYPIAKNQKECCVKYQSGIIRKVEKEECENDDGEYGYKLSTLYLKS